MALAELKFFSNSLGFQTCANVVIPQEATAAEIGANRSDGSNAHKCLYLLHGLSDDYSIWLRRTSIERYAQKYGIFVVMPDGNRSFYTDMKYGANYYTYISQELPQLMEQFFNISPRREDRYIAGLSMGGYGALKTALKNQDKYCAVAGLSSVADIRSMAERRSFGDTFTPIFGEGDIIGDGDDLFCLAQTGNEEKQKTRFYMCVGRQDFMYDDNVRLRDKFESLDYDYTYREGEGSHGWDFWDEYIQYVLEWMFKSSL